jgi:hypothetical protein
VDLPLPISLLQGIEASDEAKIVQVFELIAQKLRSQLPSVDSAAISARVKTFEQRYVETTEITSHLRLVPRAAAGDIQRRGSRVVRLRRLPGQSTVAR